MVRQVWTPPRLELLLRAVCLSRGCAVTSRAGMARALEVHPSTVRRWLRRKGGWRGAPAAIPEARLEGFLHEVRPSADELEREKLQEENAWGALVRLRAGRVALPAWKSLDWMSEHRVWIEQGVLGFGSVRFTRIGTRRDRPEAGAVSVESAVMPSRFEAVLLRAAVLAEVHLWRVCLRGMPGGSSLWISGVPMRSLDLIAEDIRRGSANISRKR